MVRLSFVLLLGLVVLSCSLASPLDNGAELTEIGHDNGELQNLYQEWKRTQPEGRSGSFENYLEWLGEQRELDTRDSNAADDAAIEKRGCSWGCNCCPVWCGIRCDW